MFHERLQFRTDLLTGPPTAGRDVAQWWYHLDGLHPLATHDLAGVVPHAQSCHRSADGVHGLSPTRLTHPK
jgi:hypothetical protein